MSAGPSHLVENGHPNHSVSDRTQSKKKVMQYFQRTSVSFVPVPMVGAGMTSNRSLEMLDIMIPPFTEGVKQNDRGFIKEDEDQEGLPSLNNEMEFVAF